MAFAAISPKSPLCRAWKMSIRKKSGLYSFGSGIAFTKDGSVVHGSGLFKCIRHMFSQDRSCQFSKDGRSAWHKWQIPCPPSFPVDLTCRPKWRDNDPTFANAGQSPFMQTGIMKIRRPLFSWKPVKKASCSCWDRWSINFLSGFPLCFFAL